MGRNGAFAANAMTCRLDDENEARKFKAVERIGLYLMVMFIWSNSCDNKRRLVSIEGKVDELRLEEPYESTP